MLVECSAALFAEDAGTHDPDINTNWPREYGQDRFASGIDDPAGIIQAERAEVTAYCANERARRFYARHGFAAFTVTATHAL